ncbi:16S rRNA (guanine(527)-N(7))-methyltransferase RsmG [Sphingomonas sp. IW22]|uniref:16S rRNA (guanine(527)-N(7))-methyltransferase RsmG n=1 Tax=Sphingomonas sp. IW22 TaxID=3242489 RepID=UPI0035200D94
MNEEQAREWIATRWGGGAVDRLSAFVALLVAESERQNLIARSTLTEVWQRHVLDSAQLVPLAEQAGEGAWHDVGTGAGLPGLVVAILQSRPVVLIEPRRKRVEFLSAVVDQLGLNATTYLGKAESLRTLEPAAVISARAVASLDDLFASSAHLSAPQTLWLLPKGKSGESELVDARRTWQGVFHVEQSLTASESGIIVAKKVQRR